MPFRRHRKAFGRRRRKGPRYNTFGAVRYLAKKAWRGIRYIRGMINVEKHYYDRGSIAGDNVLPGGIVYPLSQVAQGDDVNNRNGNSILAKSLFMRFTLRRVAGNADNLNTVRVMVVKDLENIGVTPAVTDVLQAATVTAPLNVDHTSRYQVIMDKHYALTFDRSGLDVRKYFKINDHLKFTGPNGTDVYKNALYLIIIGDQGASYPVIYADSRLGFYDN